LLSWLGALILAATAATGAHTPQPAAPAVPMRLFSMGSQAWEISIDRAKAQPHWDFETGSPPMPVAAATQKARAWIAGRNGDRPLELTSVTLQRIRRNPDVDFWYYRVAFSAAGQSGPPLTVLILADGSIVEPTPLPGPSGPSGPSGSSGPSSPSAAATPALPPGAVRPGNGVTMPKIVQQVKASYTPQAVRAKITGVVMVECVVGVDGAPRDCRVSRSLDQQFGLDQEALKAASQWRFEPGTRDGMPVPVVVSIELGFYLAK